MQNANGLLSQTLENVPQVMAIEIWSTIRREWRESFHVWTAFVNAGFKERTFKHFLKLNSEDYFPLLDTISKIASPGCRWVVSLTLASVTLSAAEFKELSRITNLQALHIQFQFGSASSNFDDRIMKVWSDRAREDGAFTRLEAMSLLNTPNVTVDAFKHLNAFPAIVVFACSNGSHHGRRVYEKAKRYGWREAKALSLSFDGLKMSYSASVPNDSKRATSVSSGRHVKTVGYAKDLVERQLLQRTSLDPSIPYLDVQLGSMLSPGGILEQNSVLCFERDPDFVAPEVPKAPRNHGNSPKRRKLNSSKGADFVAMLGTG